MKVGQLKSGMSPHHLPLLLLLLLGPRHGASDPRTTLSTLTEPLPTLYVPIGVGETPNPTVLNDGFGAFSNHISEKDDIKAEFATCGKKTLKGLNPNFHGNGGDLEVYINCEPSPDKVIVRTDGQPHNYGTLPFDLNKECELLTCSTEKYPNHKASIGRMDVIAYFEVVDAEKNPIPGQIGDERPQPNVPVIAAAPERKETNVCADKKAGYSKDASGSILFANEGQCYNTYAGLKDALEAKAGVFMQVPRWLEDGQKTRNIRSAFYDGEHSNFRSNRIPYGFTSPSTFPPSSKYQPCNSACDSGTIVKLTMKDTKYKMLIVIDPTKCSSFRICLAPKDFNNDETVPTCDDQKIIDVQTKNGIVMWPNMGRASLIELQSPKADPSYPVLVEFGYGIDVNGVEKAEYYIGNDHREIVTSTSSGFVSTESKKLVFFFPTEDCLKEKAGIFTRYAETGKALSSKPLTVGKAYDDKLNPINAEQNEKPTTTTEEPIVNLIASTTVSAPRAIPGIAQLDKNQAPLIDDIGSQRATYKAGKWWTWGLYLGFVIGTLITLGLGAGLFYLVRRTIFGIWYRGMYKRYGCDVSGTTGGITGVGFGNTVTGDVTVQGTTGGTTVGGGTTTGTSTGTSTGGGTTGGTSTVGGATETSTLLDKTETKSIAM